MCGSNELDIGQAKQRMSEAGKIGRNIQLGVSSNELTPKFEGQARDIAARTAGLSPTTFQRAVKIIEKGSEELRLEKIP